MEKQGSSFLAPVQGFALPAWLARSGLIRYLLTPFIRMPAGLRGFTAFAMVIGIAAAIGAFQPSSALQYVEAGKEVPLNLGTYWSMGFGPLSLALAISCGFFVYGVLRARHWLPMMATVSMWTLFTAAALQWGFYNLATLGLFTAAVGVTWYFHGNQKVNDYFASPAP